MEGPFSERDWKYLRSIHDEMLHKLCADINARAAILASGDKGNPHKMYLALYSYIEKADKIVADCFNDWRRSRLSLMLLNLRRHHVLSDEHVKHLSEGAQQWLEMVERMGRE